MKKVIWIVLATAFMLTLPAEEPRRGFTVDVGMFDETSARELSSRWNANIVRYHMRPIMWASRKKVSYAEAWKMIVADLPAVLDAAQKNNILLVLTLQGGIPNEKSRSYPQGKERLSAIWDDPSNLEILKQCWRDVAEVCKDRPQEIWFDILNEPLDWRDFPSYPKKWPDWAQQTIDEIRKINTRHAIVIEPGPGGLCWGFKDFPLLRGAPLIYSAHCYQPHAYSHQGVKDLQGTDLAKPYLERQKHWPGIFGDGDGGRWDKERLELELLPVIEFQKKHQVSIFIGEFSVARWAPDAPQFLRDNIEIFEKYQWSWTYHAWRESYIWDAECPPEFNTSKARTAEPGDRAKVLLEYMKRNSLNYKDSGK